MTQRRHDPLLQEIRKLGAAVCADSLPDAALLERFTTERDEAAFTALVRRHGPMVLSVCRRVLRHDADADDAWQATFVVLARRASSIRKKDSLGSWLHGAAYRIAAHLRRDLARHHARERSASEVPETPAAEVTWREVQEVLDEELGRLAEKYRTPIVLCYLEGKTRDEAARELGWSLGTLRGRLERARELLRSRLARRGITLSAALLTVLISRDAVSGAVSSTLVSAAVRAASLTVAGETLHGVVSPRVLALAEGVVKAMSATRLVVAAVLLLALGFAGVGLLARQAPTEGKGGDSVPKKEPPASAKPDPGTSKPAAEPAAPPEEEAAWSKPINGLQGRLVVARKQPFNGTPILAVYLELRNITNNAGVMELPADAWQLQYTVTDGDGKEVAPVSGPYDETTAPWGTLRLPLDSLIRLNVTHRGAGVPQNRGAHLDLGTLFQWNFPRGDTRTYYLKGRLATPEIKGNVWMGVLDLPPVELPVNPLEKTKKEK